MKSLHIVIALLLAMVVQLPQVQAASDPAMSPPQAAEAPAQPVDDTLTIGQTAFFIEPINVPEELTWQPVTSATLKYTIGSYQVEITQTDPNRVQIRWFDTSGNKLATMPVYRGTSGRWVLSLGIDGRVNPFAETDDFYIQNGFLCTDTFIYLHPVNLAWEVGIPQNSGRICPAVPSNP